MTANSDSTNNNSGFDINKDFRKLYAAADIGRYDVVITLAKNILRVQPESAEAFVRLAFAYYWTRQYELGVEAAAEAVRLNSNDSYKHALYGRLLDLVGRYEESEREHSIALALNPTDPRNYYWYALLLFDTKNYDKASHYFRKATELGPKSADYHYMTGCTLDHLKRSEEAAQEYQ